ncbi:MAG: ABC transporter permease subunit [Planctomycetes bacterium]|nr:ABC transporter permease subunit [Planctomycetota bacterium]
MKRFEVLDPVTLKEIFGISRRGQTYFGRVVYVGLIGLIMYQFWSSIVSSTPFLSPSVYAQLGRELFSRFVPLQMIMVSLASIGAAADRVIREERAGTLGLLLLTPLNAKRIAYSKWKAAMAQAGSLILCGVPVVAVCVYLGSVRPWDLLWCFALTGAMAMLGAAAGLRASAVCVSVPRALVLALLYVLGYALLPLTLLFIAGVGAIYAAPFLHPVYSAYWLVFGKVGSDSIWNFAWIPATIVSYLASRYIVSGVGILIERRVRTPRAPALPADTGPVTTVQKLGKKPERLTREVWEGDPLLWKEMLTRTGSRWSAEVKSMFLVYSLIFIALCWLFTRGTSLGTFSFLGALFCFLALVNGASLFAPEKEGRKIEMLLSSPISSYAIVRSKLVAGVASPESLRILVLALVTAVGFSWWSGPGVFLYVGVLLLFLLFVFMLSAAASLHAATLQGAALATAGILCCILLVLPIVVSILSPPGESLPAPLYLLSTLNPVWILEPLDMDRGLESSRAFGRFLLFGAVYGAAISGLGGLMLWRFDRIMGRT